MLRRRPISEHVAPPATKRVRFNNTPGYRYLSPRRHLGSEQPSAEITSTPSQRRREQPHAGRRAPTPARFDTPPRAFETPQNFVLREVAAVLERQTENEDPWYLGVQEPRRHETQNQARQVAAVQPWRSQNVAPSVSAKPTSRRQNMAFRPPQLTTTNGGNQRGTITLTTTGGNHFYPEARGSAPEEPRGQEIMQNVFQVADDLEHRGQDDYNVVYRPSPINSGVSGPQSTDTMPLRDIKIMGKIFYDDMNLPKQPKNGTFKTPCSYERSSIHVRLFYIAHKSNRPELCLTAQAPNGQWYEFKRNAAHLVCMKCQSRARLVQGELFSEDHPIH